MTDTPKPTTIEALQVVARAEDMPEELRRRARDLLARIEREQRVRPETYKAA